ncbi:MAG: hypothetical protein ACR2I7_08745 [Geodermatophilaceae bacterium]
MEQVAETLADRTSAAEGLDGTGWVGLGQVLQSGWHEQIALLDTIQRAVVQQPLDACQPSADVRVLPVHLPAGRALTRAFGCNRDGAAAGYSAPVRRGGGLRRARGVLPIDNDLWRFYRLNTAARDQ